MEPLRIALLTSHPTPGIAGLLDDPNRGTTWELAVAIDANTAPSDDAALADLLGSQGVDYILMYGYPSFLPESVVDKFAAKILVLHEALGHPGPRGVRDAILAGEPETRSAIHLLTGDGGSGPLFLLGPAFPLAAMARDAQDGGDVEFLRAYAELHRRWMASTWPEMFARALELLAGGTMHVIGDVVWIDGAPGPCRFGESPRACHEPETRPTRGIPRSCPFIAEA